MDRQLKVSLESSVTLVVPSGSKARLLLEKYGISSILGFEMPPYNIKLTNINLTNSRRASASVHCL